MSDIPTYVPELLRLVRLYYHGWNDFSHALFVKDELDYKRASAAFAREQLDRDSLSALLDAGDTAGFLARLNSVAGKTNLLYMGTPKTGDLALIKQPDADPGPICRAVFDLLHDSGDATERLGAFCDFVAANNLPQRWTFPTYFLFLLYPESEIFVKPRVTQWLSKFTGGAIPYDPRPGATAYAAIRDGFHALRDGLAAHGAADMIDTQSFVYAAYQMATKGEPSLKAVETLRAGLAEMGQSDELRDILMGQDEVYRRYGPLFSPERIHALTSDEFASFLDFKNNRHWSGIDQYVSLVTGDMPALREALAGLLDESRPLAEVFDKARNVKGLGKARITPFLNVARPNLYGVWNSKSEQGLRRLGIYPNMDAKATEGQQYEAINETLLWLAETLEIDLWTLDTLWEWLAKSDPKPLPLPPPFDAIFADRAQAEWAFDLFADAVERLGGGPDDPRFALTLPHKMMRLNIGNSMALDFSDKGKKFQLTALIDRMREAYNLSPSGNPFKITTKGTAHPFGIFSIPQDLLREWPEELQSIFEQSMELFGNEFFGWGKTSFSASHNQNIFDAFFDAEKREELLTGGMAPVRYWRITLPSDLSDDLSNDRGPYNLWAECLRHGVAAIDFDNDFQHPQVKKFAQIAPGDRVVAFLRNRTIGGIGVVTTPFDEQTAREQPAERNYFRGGFWQRVGVDWTAKELDVDKLPKAVQNKFGQSTVIEISESDFAEVEKLMNEMPPLFPPLTGPSIANEFKGFTADAFAFLRDLAANNNKAWMDANRERWKAGVLEPMRALFTDLGPPVKKLFDPYLLPDELEITPTAHKVLARIYKNWAARPNSEYHEYYWGAFYRSHLSRQTDAQLFITMFHYQMRFGLFIGRSASMIRDRFRDRVLRDPEGFYELLRVMGLTTSIQHGWSFETGDREIIDVRSSDDLIKWVDSGDYDLLRVIPPEQSVALGPALADTILDTFRRVFTIYLLAVADEPDNLIERYLAAEFPDPDPDEEVDLPPPPYTFADLTRHTYLDKPYAAELHDMLLDKRQAIFYGPPGTGKTFVARHLGRLLTGLADPPPERLTVIQFHPAYGYEEFIEGIRPKGEKGEDGRTTIDYPVKPGAFVRFCRAAAQQGDKPCVFIIDEINRGNIPRIFGELMLLLEYRDQSVPLPYSGDRFRIPPNVYVIGTMNTADRSIALVDFALRRRFHFAHFAADPDLFDRWLAAHPPTLPWLGALYRRLTAEAIDDEAYRIGPSVFMRPGITAAQVERAWRYSVMPLLHEYYFDQRPRAELWAWDGDLLHGIRGDHGG